MLKTLIAVIFAALVSPAALAAQTVVLPATALDGAMSLVSWEFRLIQGGRQGALRVSPGLAALGMPELTWPLPRGFMGARIGQLDSASVNVTAAGDHLRLTIGFLDGSLGNAFAQYRIHDARLEADLIPTRDDDGKVAFAASGTRLYATVENTRGAVGELYLGKARQDFAELAGAVARTQLTRYFSQPETQAAMRALMLWWARNQSSPGAREVDARSIRLADGVLSFDVIE